MFSEAPPSSDEMTTSRTCADSVDVNTFTSSGITAPASVPHVMTVESFHHNEPSPSVGISRYDAAYVSVIETNEVSQTRRVSGASKFMWSALAYWAFDIASFTRYETPEATTMTMRIMKIQTSSWTCVVGLLT